jgi:hypothetical protein
MLNVGRKRPTSKHSSEELGVGEHRGENALWHVVTQLMHDHDEMATEVSLIKKKLIDGGQTVWLGQYPAFVSVLPGGTDWTQDDRLSSPVRVVFCGLQVQVTSASPLPALKRVLPLPVAGPSDKFSKVCELLKELQSDFGDLQHRVVLANDLECALSKLEQQLTDSDGRYLLWGVSLLKDVFSYNYAEDMTEAQVGEVGAALDSCRKMGSFFSKDDYDRIYRKLLGLGLSLLPNSEKAIAKQPDE